MDLKDLSNSGNFVRVIVEEIEKPKSQGGYERTSMSDYEYLLADISLPWWCQILIVLLGGAASWFTSVWLVKNDWREWSPNRLWQHRRT